MALRNKQPFIDDWWDGTRYFYFFSWALVFCFGRRRGDLSEGNRALPCMSNSCRHRVLYFFFFLGPSHRALVNCGFKHVFWAWVFSSVGHIFSIINYRKILTKTKTAEYIRKYFLFLILLKINILFSFYFLFLRFYAENNKKKLFKFFLSNAKNRK